MALRAINYDKTIAMLDILLILQQENVVITGIAKRLMEQNSLICMCLSSFVKMEVGKTGIWF